MNFPSAIWVSLVERFLSCPPSWNLLERGGADSVQPNYRRENAQTLLAQCKHLFGLGLEDNAVSYKQIQPAHLTQKLWKALKYLDVIAVKSRFCWKTKTFSVQTHTLQKSGFQLRADRGSVFLELRMLPVLKFTKHFERKKQKPTMSRNRSIGMKHKPAWRNSKGKHRLLQKWLSSTSQYLPPGLWSQLDCLLQQMWVFV